MNPEPNHVYAFRPSWAADTELLMDALSVALYDFPAGLGPSPFAFDIEVQLTVLSACGGALAPGWEDLGVEQVEVRGASEVWYVPTRDPIGILWSEELRREGVSQVRREAL